MKKAILAACLVGLCGCTVTPEINYHDWDEAGRDDTWVPYQLTDTTLVIGIANTSADNSAPEDKNASTDKKNPKVSTSPRSSSGHKKTGTSSSGVAATSDDTAQPAAQPSDQAALLQPVYRYQLYPISLSQKDLSCLKQGCVGNSVEAAAVPIAYEGISLGIEPASHWLIYTRMAPTYYANSLRLQSLEFSVEDKRQEVLDTVGALALGVARMSSPVSAVHAMGAKAADAASAKTLKLPIIIDLADAKAALGTQLDLPRNADGGWKYSIQFLDDPDKAGFTRLADRKGVHHAVLTSLCRPLQIMLTNGDINIVLGVTVADPDYLLPIPLPPSGTVTFGTLCGADVKMTKAAETSTSALVTSFFNDVQSIRATQRKPK